MSTYQNVFWGYEIAYPDFWFYKKIADTDYFFLSTNSFDPLYEGEDAGRIAIRGEWNWARKDIKPLWSEHIGLLAGMMGAKDVGSAPWRMGDAVGMEAEIVLAKKENRRLWTGILTRGFCVLHFMVVHPIVVREKFEPAATKILSSLRFPEKMDGVLTTPEGLPLPPDYSFIDPGSIINNIEEPSKWFAYDGQADIGALQSFFLRELTKKGWEITEYVPYITASDLGFARYTIANQHTKLILGLMPAGTNGDVEGSPVPARIVYKLSSA